MHFFSAFAAICWLMISALLPGSASAAVEGTKVKIQVAEVSLVTESSTFIPGEPFFVALKIALPEGWHTYWQNPGDSGLPTEIHWMLPEGFTSGPIHWPTPERIEWQGIVNYGYSGEAYLLVPITSKPDYDGEAILTAQANWLVCKDICIPESAELSIRLRADAQMQPVEDKRFQAVLSALPKPLKQKASFGLDDKQLVLSLPEAIRGIGSNAEFFPITPNLISSVSAPIRHATGSRDYMVFSRLGQHRPEALSGVLKSGKNAWVVEARYSPDISFSEKDLLVGAPLKAEVGFLTAILFALLGGIILNAMPCVFPILSLKLLKLVNIASHSRVQAMRHGVAYTSGVMLSFLLIAGLLVALQKAGYAIGWGFQLQSPLFVTLMIFLLFLIGLNLSGMFSLPSFALGFGHKQATGQGISGTFFTGALATLVATPCTAPFMATALGYALTQGASSAMAVFLALGLGLALPYLLVSVFPALARMLPKPGSWMERFRQFLAFPIYATMVWLLWVLGLQAGISGMTIALSGLVILALMVWVNGLGIKPGNKWMVSALLGFLLFYALLTARGQSTYQSMQEVDVAPYSEKTLSDLLRQKQAVFVNATAAWCITCKVNETVALSSPRVHQHFKESGIVMLVADWTKSDPEVTRFLRSHQRQGVPLYVYYSREGKPHVLPQLLTSSIIIEQTQ